MSSSVQLQHGLYLHPCCLPAFTCVGTGVYKPFRNRLTLRVQPIFMCVLKAIAKASKEKPVLIILNKQVIIMQTIFCYKNGSSQYSEYYNVLDRYNINSLVKGLFQDHPDMDWIEVMHPQDGVVAEFKPQDFQHRAHVDLYTQVLCAKQHMLHHKDCTIAQAESIFDISFNF